MNHTRCWIKNCNEQIFRRSTLKNKNTLSLAFAYNKIFKGEKEEKGQYKGTSYNKFVRGGPTLSAR